MRIVFASDTHMSHAEVPVPPGDVFVHCGDFSSRGTLADVRAFGEWLATLPHARKVVVAGNHDFALQEHPERAPRLLGPGVDYLLDGGVTIDGVRFWGSPWQPVFCDWAFNLDRAGLRKKWALVPKTTDVLVTHGPPHSVLDQNRAGKLCGDEELLLRVRRVRPVLHAFGHIHEGSGSVVLDSITFVNAAIMDDSYTVAHPCRVADLARTPRGALQVRESLPTYHPFATSSA